MTLRINARRITPAAYLEELKARGIPFLRVGRSAVMLQSPLPVKDIPGFTEGIVSVQDAGTQLAAEILAPQKMSRSLTPVRRRRQNSSLIRKCRLPCNSS